MYIISRRPIIDFNHPLTKDLVFDWLPFQKGNTLQSNLVDTIKATVEGTTFPSPVIGKFGRCLDFDNTDRRLLWSNLPAARFFTYDYITVEVAFLRVNGGGGGYGTLLYHGDLSAETPWVGIGNDNGDSGWGMRLDLHYTDRERVWSIPYPSNNIWHHYFLIYNHTNKDNTPLVIGDGAPITPTSRFDQGWSETILGDNITVGRSFYGGSNEHWGGKIAFVRYWKRMLKYSEVYALHVNPFVFYKLPLFFYSQAPVSGINYTQEVTDSVALSDNIVKQSTKSMVESMSLSEILSKSLSKIPFSESIILSDNVAKQSQKPFAELWPLSDEVTKQTTKNVTELIPLTEIFSRVVIWFRAFTESFLLSESVNKSTSKDPFIDMVSLSEITFKYLQRAIINTVGVSDSIFNRVNKSLVDTVDLIDTLISTVGILYTKLLTDSITFSDSVSKKVFKGFSECIQLVDRCLKKYKNGELITTIWTKIVSVITNFTKEGKKLPYKKV